jgi:hypothetical protein
MQGRRCLHGIPCSYPFLSTSSSNFSLVIMLQSYYTIIYNIVLGRSQHKQITGLRCKMRTKRVQENDRRITSSEHKKLGYRLAGLG